LIKAATVSFEPVMGLPEFIGHGVHVIIILPFLMTGFGYFSCGAAFDALFLDQMDACHPCPKSAKGLSS
jgi:hypothetical protein